MTDEANTLKVRLEAIVAEMVERGILFEDARAEFERHFITTVLARHDGNLSRAAEELRIHRNTLGKRVSAMAPKRPRRKRPSP
jgi:Fis family transcriptional regulator, factor for inversion stimulation protein